MQTVTVVQRLLDLADIKITEPIEVIPDKAFTPANGDKRYYVSLATYCWPANPEDLENPKGPWSCKDGAPFEGVCTPTRTYACIRPMPLRVCCDARSPFVLIIHVSSMRPACIELEQLSLTVSGSSVLIQCRDAPWACPGSASHQHLSTQGAGAAAAIRRMMLQHC